MHRTSRESEELAAWLIGAGRLSGDAVTVTSGLAQRLTEMGVPLHRLRLAMRVDNPLVTAWGIVWTPEKAAEIFSISRALLDTPTYIGSPAQRVIQEGAGSGSGLTISDLTITQFSRNWRMRASQIISRSRSHSGMELPKRRCSQPAMARGLQTATPL
jgi:hypothetical protein